MPPVPVRLPRAGRAHALSAAFAALLALPAAGVAQHCTEEPCGPLDFTPPTVTIFPGTGTYAAGSLSVQISWSDDHALSHGSRQILLDGVNVTGQFTYSYPNNWTATSTGSVTVGTGSRVLSASICDHTGYNCATQTATYTGPAPAVLVTPERDSAWVPAGTAQVARFRVANTGTMASTYTLSASECAGVGVCTPSATSLTLAAQDTGVVDVGYTAPASGTGQVRLRASAGAATSLGTMQAVALAAPDPGYPGDSLSLLGSEREVCVTIAIGPGAAYECGDLRAVHGLPAVRELNRVRAPVLLYNSNHARPYPMVAAQVTPQAGTSPDSVRAVLTLNGVQSSRSWPGWATGKRRQVAVAGNAAGLATGVYPYTIEVSARWNSGASDSLLTRSGHLVVVNRGSSPFGAGWWLSGVEQLAHVGDTLKLWVGGDGSARLYRGTSAAGPWVAERFSRPDTLVRRDSLYVRTLPGGAEVHFRTTGEHVRTVNRLGDETRFTWVGGRLTRIDLPSTPDMGTDRSHYLFEYDNNTGTPHPRLSRVRAPWLTGYRNVRVSTDQYARVTAITDPYTSAVAPDTIPGVQFGYSPTVANRLWMESRTDRSGATQEFRYGAYRLSFTHRFPAAGDTITFRFYPGENRGWPQPVAYDSLQTRLDGPRGTVNGRPERNLWWVDRWGAPLKTAVMGPAGWIVTEVERGDPRWPGRVTRVVAPNGFTTTASYDGRGNLASRTEWSPYGDARHATTTYAWDERWDAVTRVTLPEGEVTQVAYDSVGRRAWEQVGPSSARRVSYTYLPKTHARAPGRLERVTLPGGAQERYEYDARGNLSATVSPLGARSELVSDRLGRVTVSRVAIDTVAGVLRFQGDSTTHYDVHDRPLRTAGFGPAMNGVGAQRVIVENQYDAEGSLLSVSRTSAPDPYGIGTVTTRWAYDALGRPILEIAPDATPGNPSDNPRDSTVYDRAGNVVEVHTRRWDDAGQRIVVRMDYDVAGRLTHRRTGAVQYSARNQGIATRGFIKAWEQEVDLNGVPPYPWYPNDGGTGYRVPADTARFVYDAMGNLLRADNRDAWIRRSYYPNGALRGDTLKVRTVAELAAGGDSTSHVYGLRHSYDRNGRRTGLQHPEGIAPRVAGVLKDQTTWSYDPLTGSLTTVVDPLGYTFRYHYDARGAVDSIQYPGGITDAYSYDLDGRLTRHRTANAATGGDRYEHAVLRDVSFSYDARGKMRSSANASFIADTTTVQYTGLGHAQYVRTRTAGTIDPRFTPKTLVLEETIHDGLGNVGGHATQRGNDAVVWGAHRYEQGTARRRAFTDAFRYDTVYYDRGGAEIFSTTVEYASQNGRLQDAAYFYGGDGRLAAADTRVISNAQSTLSPYTRSFEEYRYDALGRRIWVRARRDCYDVDRSALCEIGWVRRTLWDGDRELYEIQAPGGPQPIDEQWMESDTVRPRFAARHGHPQGQITDLNPYYGRVAYTYGAGVDQPLGVVRMGYTSRLDALNRAIGTRDFEPTTIVPLWSSRGQASIGAFADGTWRKCMPDAHCMNLAWPDLWAGYGGIQGQRSFWHGTLLEDKSDGSGLKFRRNRYYDPGTGRFTQEDPIGLAGGLNVYGFAGGDPVNFGDPFGLKVCGRTGSERSRIEQTYSVRIEWDETGCVSDPNKVHRVGSNRYKELQDGFLSLVIARQSFTVTFSRSLHPRTWQGSKIFRRRAGEYIIYIDPRETAEPYGYETERRSCHWREPWGVHALIAHELTGHGLDVVQGRRTDQVHAIEWENRWNRAVGRPERSFRCHP